MSIVYTYIYMYLFIRMFAAIDIVIFVFKLADFFLTRNRVNVILYMRLWLTKIYLHKLAIYELVVNQFTIELNDENIF